MLQNYQIEKIKRCPICKSSKRNLKFVKDLDGITSYIYKCSKCNLVYNGIKLKNRNSKVLNAKFSEGKKDIVNFKRWERLQNNKLSKIEKFLKKTPKKDHLKVLEVGCGLGALLSAAKKRGWQEYGIEPFVKSYKLAKKKKLNVVNKLLKDTKYPPNYFDLIIALEVIEHFDNPLEEFKQMKRVLNEEGVIVVQTVNVDSIKFKIKKSKSRYIYYDHLCYYSPKTMKNILDKLGMKIVKSLPDEIDFFKRMHWCRTTKEKLKWAMFYVIRAMVLNKPILGSMTLYIQKK